MAVTETEICNMALALIGIDQGIASLTEQSKAARLCNTFYQTARDSLLRDYPWNFATDFVALGELPDDPPPGWEYVYQYPADCLMARAVTDSNGARVSLSYWLRPIWKDTSDGLRLLPGVKQIPFKVLGSADGASRVIACDIPDAYLLRTRALTVTSAFDSMFIECLTWYMAHKLVMPMLGPNGAGNMSTYCAQMFNSAILRAASQNANEDRPDPLPDSEIISVRC